MSLLSKDRLSSLVAATGWEGIVHLVAGFGGILIGTLSLFNRITWGIDVIASSTLVAVGLLLTAVAAQNSSRATELLELRHALSVSEVRPLHMKHEFPGMLAQHVRAARSVVLDTNLNNEVPRFAGTSPQEEYREILEKRVRAGQIAFRQVVCIFHRDHLAEIIARLVDFSQTDYYIHHMDAPPKAIPIIHMMSFDEEHYFLGGFYSAEASTQETSIYIRHPDVTRFLKEYWNLLWNTATPLNPGRNINWAELARVAARLGLTPKEFEEMKASASS